jgi:hypothetical protein
LNTSFAKAAVPVAVLLSRAVGWVLLISTIEYVAKGPTSMALRLDLKDR